MAALQSVSWSATNGIDNSGSMYVNAGDVINITYTFDSSVSQLMRNGDRIILSNGQAASYVSNSGNTALFRYTVGNGQDTENLQLDNTHIRPGDRLTDQTGFTYSINSASPSTPYVVDTTTPGAPTITGIVTDDGTVPEHATAATSLTLTGTAEPNSAVSLFQDGTKIADTTADEAGNWSAIVGGPLTDQTTYAFTASAMDRAGNDGSASSPYNIEIDSSLCFYEGTLIRTEQGETPVEDLRIGDLVMTMSDAGPALRPVRWIGRQTVASRFASALNTHPVRIQAGALGEALPARDLLVSPEHALHLDGLLVHASALVNGTSIQRMTLAALPAVFTYFHIELEHHELVLAEGTLAETFVDNVTRRRFDNWAEYEALYGASEASTGESDMPRVKSARQLPRAIRTHLDARAEAIGLSLATAA